MKKDKRRVILRYDGEAAFRLTLLHDHYPDTILVEFDVFEHFGVTEDDEHLYEFVCSTPHFVPNKSDIEEL
ncbi:MAG: hypothetical protein NUV49_03530 [Patescibacteria group bacterium]|nr:hypothetical protein [Patescibacteria group bacterium]